MAFFRVAIIFDNTIRPETTGVYCRRALEQLTEVHFFTPAQMHQIPRKGFDLYLHIDDGLNYPLPPDLRPSAWWVIDTHMDLEGAIRRSPHFDWVFAAQRDGTASLNDTGICAHWLPLACDPEIHRPWKVENQWDFCFVGNLTPGFREDLIQLLQKRFPRSFVGQRYFEEYAKTCSASHIGFNRSVKNDINMRVFETLSCGPLLVTNDLSENGQAELFQSDKHLITYRDSTELAEKVAFYLKTPAIRERIARAGREAVQKHTYFHRMRSLLETIERSQQSSPKIFVPEVPEIMSQQSSFIQSSFIQSSSEPPRPKKDVSYFQSDRPEVVQLIPLTAQRVLDIGCGAGRLGERLKKRQSVEVTGIEFQPAAAAQARLRLDSVREQNIEDPSLTFSEGYFDCIVCADVLEHLRDPASILKKIARWLAPSGCVVVSLPNVRHYSVVTGLLDGNWTYESAGLLDDDHVRFFTRREIEKLFYRNGFSIHTLIPKPGSGYQEWVAMGRPGSVQIGPLSIGGLAPEQAGEFYTYQYLIVAQVVAPSLRPPIDVNQSIALDKLKATFPWPNQKPLVPIPKDHLGWCNECARSLLRQELSQPTTLVVELGAWLGLSTRWMADIASQAQIITIDHWEGSPEHKKRPEWAALLPLLYETFLNLNWEYRSRITPLRMNSLQGLRIIAEIGLKPDVIFIDAEHSYQAVHDELELCRQLFPDARLIGDDYHADGVRQAVDTFARKYHHTVESVGDGLPTWRLSTTGKSQKDNTHGWGLTSIIIVTFNQLAYTQECVDSILFRTDELFELIFVDNGSTDSTLDYLATIQNAKVISNRENRGFPIAVNQGLAVAQGQQIVLLNNDTVVSTGWLRKMLETLYADPQIGLVGPCSNQVSGEQQIEVTYSDISLMDGFAWELGKKHASERMETDRLVGFCLLIRRELLEQIGGMDERFGIGCFEDDDYSLRALQAGWKAVIARAAFVHHYGGITFSASKVDYESLLEENSRQFKEKWGVPEDPKQPIPQNPLDRNRKSYPQAKETVADVPVYQRASGGGLRLSKADKTEKRIAISLCMIVRDNASTIEACLRSIRPWVDEIIVVDTGSKDQTPALVQQLGAKLYHFPWPDSFSIARNESIRYAKGEWILWIDSDDTISEENGQKLRALVEQPHEPGVLGYIMQVHCPGPGPTGSLHLTMVDHVKLFRNLPELRFEGRIHEQLLPAIRRLGGEVLLTDIYVLHSGYDHTPVGQEHKKQRDLKLLNLELQDQPEHPFTLFNLGMTYADIQEFGQAIVFLRKSIKHSGLQDSHLRKVYALLVYSYYRIGQMDEAVAACELGLKLFPDDLELRFRKANLLQEIGRAGEAIIAYQQLIGNPGERTFRSIDLSMAGFKARQNLAVAYTALQDLQSAEEQWRHIIAEVPDYNMGWRGLGENLVSQGNLEEARQIAKRLEADELLQKEACIIRVRLAAKQNRYQEARIELEQGIAKNPDDLELLRIYTEFLFEQGDLPSAEEALKTLIQEIPNDASAYHNLGTVMIRKGEVNQAIECFQKAVEFQPQFELAKRHLAACLTMVSRFAESKLLWKQILENRPTDQEAAARLKQIEDLQNAQGKSASSQ